MLNNAVILAFSLTLLAGLSTGIGSAIAFFGHRTNTRFLSAALGFSAGVMIYVSFVEIFAKATDALTAALGMKAGTWAAVGGFFAGFVVIGLIDRLIPSFENPHEVRSVEDLGAVPDSPLVAASGGDPGGAVNAGNGLSTAGADDPAVPAHVPPEGSPPSVAHHDPSHAYGHAVPPRGRGGDLYRMGLFAALAIAIHNFPEGLATFMAAMRDPSLGIAIAVAIAIHNIPEGIAVSVPIFYATGSRKKAFGYSFVSGVSEPVGALIGYFLLLRFIGDILFGVVFSAVAGIMVFISLDELLPAAREYGEPHIALYGLTAGMAVMALSLLLFI